MWLALNILLVFLERRGSSAALTRTPVKYLWNPQMDEYWIFQYSVRLSAAVNSLVSCCVTCEAQVRVYEYFYNCLCKSCLGGLSHRYEGSASHWDIGAVSGVHVWSHFLPALFCLTYLFFFINEIFSLSHHRQLKPPSPKFRLNSWAFCTIETNQQLTICFLSPPWSPTSNVLQ